MNVKDTYKGKSATDPKEAEKALAAFLKKNKGVGLPSENKGGMGELYARTSAKRRVLVRRAFR